MAHSSGGRGAIITVGLAAVCVAVVLTVRGPAQVVAGLLISLVLPGYAITRGLFPGRWLDRIERVALAGALSLAVLALGGIAMYAGGARLTAKSWAELGAGVTLVAVIVGYVRQRRHSAPNWSTVDTNRQGAVPRPVTVLSKGRAVARLLPLGLAALLLTGAGALTWQSERQQEATAFTELSIVPGAPAPAGQSRQVVIGVVCHESASTQYTVTVHDADLFSTSFTPKVHQGATWARTITVPPTGTVIVDLYRGTDKTLYRSVHLS